MARQAAVHSDDYKIEQKADLTGDLKDRDPEVVAVERLPNQDYLDELKFNEEPVTIRLEPTAEKNAPTAFPVWNQGKGCEVLIDRDGRFVTTTSGSGRWFEKPYIPVGVVLTTKRKYVEIIVRAKIDTVHTEVKEKDSENPRNTIQRFTSAVHSFSIIEDRNPKGVEWLSALRRRNF